LARSGKNTRSQSEGGEVNNTPDDTVILCRHLQTATVLQTGGLVLLGTSAVPPIEISGSVRLLFLLLGIISILLGRALHSAAVAAGEVSRDIRVRATVIGDSSLLNQLRWSLHLNPSSRKFLLNFDAWHPKLRASQVALIAVLVIYFLVPTHEVPITSPTANSDDGSDANPVSGSAGSPPAVAQNPTGGSGGSSSVAASGDPIAGSAGSSRAAALGTGGAWDARDAGSCAFQCLDGTCITAEKVCNRRPDCPNADDESPRICLSPRTCCEATLRCPDETGSSCGAHCCCCPGGAVCCLDPQLGCCDATDRKTPLNYPPQRPLRDWELFRGPRFEE
jgi:hypothetical protein